MLKYIGLILIVAAGTGLGYEKSRIYVRRKQALEVLKRFVILLNGEIRCGNSSLGEALKEMSGKFDGEFGKILLNISCEMSAVNGNRFGEIFLRNLSGFFQKNHMSEEEVECLENLGRQLGYLDRQMQMRQLELCEEELMRLLGNLRLIMPEKQKLYQSLGILGGLLLAVFLW